MKNNISFNHQTCKMCQLCAEVCPNKILLKSESDKMTIRHERVDFCFKCGQCMAICTSQSIYIDGLSYDSDFFELPEKSENTSESVFYSLIQSRRAIRNFKDKSVPKEVLEKVVDAISFAPPGFPPLKYSLVVVQDTDLIRKSLPLMINLYEKLVIMMKKTITRFFIKKELGKAKFKTMQEHLIPLLTKRLPDLKNGTEDSITRNAPAMILFLADKNGEDVSADIAIAATYGMLAIHALGLGGSIMHLIPPAIEKSVELRKMFCIPDSHEVINSLIIGYPKYKYQRGIKRKIPGVKWL